MGKNFVRNLKQLIYFMFLLLLADACVCKIPVESDSESDIEDHVIIPQVVAVQQKNPSNIGYDNPKMAAITAWERELGGLSGDCAALVDSTTVKEYENIYDHCSQQISYACYAPTANLIMIGSNFSNYTKKYAAVHEYLHAIELCEYAPKYWLQSDVEYSGIDEDHYNDKVWGIRTDSVENIGYIILRELGFD